MSMNGIDISKWQSGLKIANVASDFVIIKATEGVGYKDPSFDTFINQAISLGKRIGVYHFARPYAQNFNNPKSEADWFISVIQPYIGRVMLILDWEAERKNDAAWAKEWLDRVKEVTGVRPVFYTYESCVNSYNFSSIIEYPLWVARYLDYVHDYNYDMKNAGPKPNVRWWAKYIMWQWTSSGRINGWNGNLDCNIFYEDAVAWDRYCAKEGSVIETPPEESQIEDPLGQYSDLELAEKVWKNEFGGGEQRRNALGARYEAVQKLVNQGIGKPEESTAVTPIVYIVKPGDTLSAIAAKFGTTYQKIAMDNHISNPNLIYPNQKLSIIL